MPAKKPARKYGLAEGSGACPAQGGCGDKKIASPHMPSDRQRGEAARFTLQAFVPIAPD
ncbi:MAG TPA: hypothetical protein VKD65_07895 [Candidatus Angelobacter sp.]|nr:hypothetical protein [Candidatus Angelobacter sp.]